MKTCNSCNKEVTGEFIEFRCPKCSKSNIVRCFHCRDIAKEYSCEECKFVGP